MAMLLFLWHSSFGPHHSESREGRAEEGKQLQYAPSLKAQPVSSSQVRPGPKPCGELRSRGTVSNMNAALLVLSTTCIDKAASIGRHVLGMVNGLYIDGLLLPIFL